MLSGSPKRIWVGDWSGKETREPNRDEQVDQGEGRKKQNIPEGDGEEARVELLSLIEYNDEEELLRALDNSKRKISSSGKSVRTEEIPSSETSSGGA
jgi:hypothetical protein